MSELSIEQQRALALAAARRRRSEATDELNRRRAKRGEPPFVAKPQGSRIDQLQAELDRRKSLGENGGRGDRSFNITTPEGKTFRVTGESQEGAMKALRSHLAAGTTPAEPGVPAGPRFPGVPVGPRFAGVPVNDEQLGPQHPEFDGSAIPGYDPATGTVDNSKSDSAILAALTGTLEGIPIAGPFLQSGTEHAAAGIGSLMTDQQYSNVHREMSGMVDSAQESNPTTTKVSNVGGAVLGTIPAMLAAPQAFGMGAGNFLVRSAASALTGGAIGGADAAVRSGGDTASVVTGSLAGLGTGALGPAAGALLGAGYRATANFIARRGAAKISELTPQAVGQLVKAMEADGIPASEIQQRLAALGPQGMLADLGANLQQTAAGLVARPGPARAIVQDAMRGRDAGANQRIRSSVDEALGPSPLPSQVTGGIEANQQSLSPLYREALQNARPVHPEGIARFLDRESVNLRGEAQRAVSRVRGMLNRLGSDELETSPAVLLETRKAVDGMLETTVDSNALRALSTARQAIDDQLRWSVPGIKEVDAKFAELARQRDAFQRGQQTLESGRTAPRPEELAQEVQEGALPQGMQIGPSAAPVRLREGARAEIDRIIGTNANDRVALQRLIKGEGDWNRDRLVTLFGADRANRLVALLDAERTFADTSNFVTRNSATAARQQAVKELGGGNGESFGVREGYMAGGFLGAGRSTAVTALERIIEALKGAGRNTEHAALARALTSGDLTVAEALRIAGTPPSRRGADGLSNVARALMLGSATNFAGR